MHILLALFASLALLIPGTGIVAANMLERDNASSVQAPQGFDGDIDDLDDRFDFEERDFDEQFDFDSPYRQDVEVDLEDLIEQRVQRQFMNGQRGTGQNQQTQQNQQQNDQTNQNTQTQRQNGQTNQNTQTQRQNGQTNPQPQQDQQGQRTHANQNTQDTQTNGTA